MVTTTYESKQTQWANLKISNIFSPIFPSFVYFLSTKSMAKWSRAPGQFLGGQWVEHKAEFCLFFLSNFQTFYLFNFQQRVAKLGAFPINLIIFKAPPVQF